MRGIIIMLCVKNILPNPLILYTIINNKLDDVQANLIINKKSITIVTYIKPYSGFVMFINEIDFCHDSKYFLHKTTRVQV